MAIWTSLESILLQLWNLTARPQIHEGIDLFRSCSGGALTGGGYHCFHSPFTSTPLWTLVSASIFTELAALTLQWYPGLRATDHGNLHQCASWCDCGGRSWRRGLMANFNALLHEIYILWIHCRKRVVNKLSGFFWNCLSVGLIDMLWQRGNIWRCMCLMCRIPGLYLSRIRVASWRNVWGILVYIRIVTVRIKFGFLTRDWCPVH